MRDDIKRLENGMPKVLILLSENSLNSKASLSADLASVIENMLLVQSASKRFDSDKENIGLDGPSDDIQVGSPDSLQPLKYTRGTPWLILR